MLDCDECGLLIVTNMGENIAVSHEFFFYNVKEKIYKLFIVTFLNYNGKHKFHKYYLKVSTQKSDIIFTPTNL